MKQTAVEWLVDVLLHYHNTEYSKRIIDQAKQMEKEQIMDAWKYGRPYLGNVEDRDAEQYYNETYKKEKK